MRALLPFGALSASYFAHIGFFNPYLPLWLKELGLPLVAISLLTSAQSATRLFAPYAWGALSDRLGERVRLMRYSATVALLLSLGLWREAPSVGWLAAVLLLMFSHTSAMMPMSEAAMAHLVSQGGQFDARRYGRVRLCGSLGFLLTVFLAGAWFERRGMHDFPAWTLLTLLAVVGSAWWLPDQREARSADEHAHLPVGPVLRQPERWQFNFGGPNALVQVEYWQGNRSVGVTTTHNGVLATLNNLHKGTGMSVPWILLVDALAGSMIFLSLSGLVLWVQMNRRRAVGVGIFSASLLITLGCVLPRL